MQWKDDHRDIVVLIEYGNVIENKKPENFSLLVSTRLYFHVARFEDFKEFSRNSKLLPIPVPM